MLRSVKHLHVTRSIYMLFFQATKLVSRHYLVVLRQLAYVNQHIKTRLITWV